MEEFTQYHGYDQDFLGEGLRVRLPRVSGHIRAEVAPVPGSRNGLLHYQNFSLLQHARRRFPIYTATNIHGRLFQRIPRHDRWRLDARIADTHQWGPSLYAADKSDFDRGHMTKREDVQWGNSPEEAKRGALSTFYYTNAVPQVAKLNQQLWRGLEDYILKHETVENDLKISMFTGPVLADDDPVFVTEVDGQTVQLPTLFWKVIYFAKSDGQVYRVAFLMGQEELLERQGLIHPRPASRLLVISPEERMFMQFKKADIFQVNIATIRKLTGLGFSAGQEPYRDDRPIALIRKEVQGRSLDGQPIVIIDGLQL